MVVLRHQLLGAKTNTIFIKKNFTLATNKMGHRTGVSLCANEKGLLAIPLRKSRVCTCIEMAIGRCFLG